MSKEITVLAIRGNSVGKEREVSAVFQLHEKALSIIAGGVTGYESF